MVERVNITIDGKAVSVPEDMTILAAAEGEDIKIPSLCFYWGVNDCGACRICCVELEGSDQLVASCNNRVYEGMSVKTDTDKVRRTRYTNLELILSQHEVKCTSCVRSGYCQLQELANDMNMGELRFETSAEPFVWNTDIPVIRDASKCIKCMRCVHVCDHEHQAVGIWDLKNRASRKTIGVSNNQVMEESPCTYCGQCIIHCPTGALRERDDIDAVLSDIANPDITTVIQIAPSVRAAWGEPLGLSHDQATVKLLAAALRRIGFDYIFDTDFSADLTIMEEGSEFIERFTHRDDYAWPMLTSCCPAWIRYIKGQHPDMIENLSTAKSPQGMLGPVIKTYWAEKMGIDAGNIRVISIMPCTAKKHEAAIPNLQDAGFGPDTDYALTVREIDRLIKSSFIDCSTLQEEELDSPLGIGTGAAVIFGATGGVMEAALRTAYKLVAGENPDPDAFFEVRGLDGWKEAQYEINGLVVRVAIASGLANAEKLIQAIKAGEVEYDFVEVMSCPGGCVNGGGQPISTSLARAFVRGEVLYGLDKKSEYRFSHENPSITQVYEEYFGAPLSERSHHLLHTDHHGWVMPSNGK